jgi:hydrogenase nickel incorporation protein HypA/HybF
MHELSLVQNIFSTILEVARANRLRAIKKVSLQIGQLRQVKPDFLQFAFQAVAQDTIAAGAVLEIEFIPLTIFCHRCNKNFIIKHGNEDDAMAGYICVCPECGAYGCGSPSADENTGVVDGKLQVEGELESTFVAAMSAPPSVPPKPQLLVEVLGGKEIVIASIEGDQI